MNQLTNLTCLISKLLPNIDEIVDKQNHKTNQLPIDKMTNILSKTDIDKIPLELEFFGGGKNQLSDNYVKALQLSPNYFIPIWEKYKEILLPNKLKIHVETGNIYYDNQNTNESIYSFFTAQKDPDKAFIDFEFTFADSYEDYFEWLIVSFDSYEKTKLDILANKNSKFLFYRFNDFLLQRLREPKLVRHYITDDYVALDRIQNQNWQYLIESILDACKSNNSGEANEIKKLKIVENSVENITICKKAYQSFYDQIAQNLINTINELPAHEIEEINGFTKT